MNHLLNKDNLDQRMLSDEDYITYLVLKNKIFDEKQFKIIFL